MVNPAVDTPVIDKIDVEPSTEIFPWNVLAALPSVKVPALTLSVVPVPVPLITPLVVIEPAPDFVKAFAARFVAATVTKLSAAGAKVAAPVRVVAPKVTPPVPLVASEPRVMLRVCAPMLSVPSV